MLLKFFGHLHSFPPVSGAVHRTDGSPPSYQPIGRRNPPSASPRPPLPCSGVGGLPVSYATFFFAHATCSPCQRSPLEPIVSARMESRNVPSFSSYLHLRPFSVSALTLHKHIPRPVRRLHLRNLRPPGPCGRSRSHFCSCSCSCGKLFLKGWSQGTGSLCLSTLS